MSKLREKISKLETRTKIAAKKKEKDKSSYAYNVVLSGYKVENNKPKFLLETNNETLKSRIKENSLSDIERYNLINIVGQYYDEYICKDANLFNSTIGKPLVAYYTTGNSSMPGSVINSDALPLACQKNQKTKQISFSKHKFKKLAMEDKIKFIKDPMLLFVEMYGSPYYNRKSNINELISLPGMENEASMEDSKTSTVEFTKTKKFKRKFISK